ncbi:MAG TPA: phosphoenolpyruvate carboxykinase (ATP) [Proteobacteria bacterium]|nr:phosphoenolpyruvate carboxykinase (ATP) [Pseudomonadota bacterium]
MVGKYVLPGFSNLGRIYYNLPTPALYEQIVRRREGLIAHLGPVVVRTGHYTGRSPHDKFIVKDEFNKDKVWWGEVNVPIEPEIYYALEMRLKAYLQGRDIFVHDCFAGADPEYRLRLRVITETAWHNLFARNMFRRDKRRRSIRSFKPDFTLIHAPNFKAQPEVDGTNSEAFIIANFTEKKVIIGGTAYGGEIKKSIFTVMNYLLPQRKVLGMHCSANVGKAGDVALFFGLSGTGKTTLSNDPDRSLIGDDEHGWSERGIFNFEGGCYAKVINLSPEDEPEIYACTRRFGTILENVAIDMETRTVDLNDASLTVNTRASYPLDYIPNAIKSGMGGHPKNIIMLTADAFGVMPPIAKMTPAQAMYHFLSGYTAKVAGTERGITEPVATFSACFGAPFMVLHPTVYAELLGKKIAKHKVQCWLINTGWTGGPYGEGSRIKIAYTRAMVAAALEGKLDDVEFKPHPIFNVLVPVECPGVPKEILWPKNTWRNKRAYTIAAKRLARLFAKNFKEYEKYASKEIKEAAPRAE